MILAEPSKSRPIIVDGSILLAPMVGVRRYVTELMTRLGDLVTAAKAPPRPLQAVRGGIEFWRQGLLPFQLHGRLLWSPWNTGPYWLERQVLTLHDILPIDHPGWVGRGLRLHQRLTLPKLVRRVRAILADSAFTKQRLIAALGAEESKITVVPLGVGPHFRPRTGREIAEARQVLGLPQRLVLAGASPEPRKNLSRVLDAWNRVRHDLPSDVWLVMVGRDTLPGLPRLPAPPRAVYLGAVAESLLPALYAAAEVFVYPSLYEGFGLPALEAMACGTPVLTSATTSLPEVVGDAAIMVQPDEPNAIASAIRLLAQNADLRLDLRRRGIDRAGQLGWGRAADETRSVLTAAMGSQPQE